LSLRSDELQQSAQVAAVRHQASSSAIWLRRTIRSTGYPYAAMSMRGRVVVTFVHRTADLDVSLAPVAIDAFATRANASASTPTMCCRVSDDKAFFTVTLATRRRAVAGRAGACSS
jgi:hypothetical protein